MQVERLKEILYCRECKINVPYPEICPSCGRAFINTEINIKPKFCSHCGKELIPAQKCPRCSKELITLPIRKEDTSDSVEGQRSIGLSIVGIHSVIMGLLILYLTISFYERDKQAGTHTEGELILTYLIVCLVFVIPPLYSGVALFDRKKNGRIIGGLFFGLLLLGVLTTYFENEMPIVNFIFLEVVFCVPFLYLIFTRAEFH